MWAPVASAQREKGVQFGEIDGMWITDPAIIGFRKYDRVAVEVNVNSGAPVDVYIMSEREYEKLSANEAFGPEVSKEGVDHTKFTWENPDGGKYYLVIDNMDNPRSDDAIPTSDVTYTYTADIEERYHDVEMRQITEAGVILAVVIIIISVVVIIRIKRRN